MSEFRHDARFKTTRVAGYQMMKTFDDTYRPTFWHIKRVWQTDGQKLAIVYRRASALA